MKKVWAISWKDLLVLFRDRGALILMLAAPFALTLGLGLVSGAFSDNNSTGTGLADIPLAVVNLDDGELGQALVDTLSSADLADLLQPVEMTDTAVARQQVEADELAALVVIPVGFTASIIPQGMGGTMAVETAVEVYASPARPISASVVEGVVQNFVNRVDMGVVSTEVAMTQLVMNGIVPFDQVQAASQEIGQRQMMQDDLSQVIEIRQETAVTDPANTFNTLAYFAPGMAIVFLMYTVSLGGRSFLDERSGGTLARLLATPSSSTQVLGGKVLGIFLSGVVQVGVLILASTLFFSLYWGDALGVILLVLTVAFAATGWGLLLASFAKTPAQVSTYGTALMLIFGVLGGGFAYMPRVGLVGVLGKLTPNAWALDGFLNLHQGGTLSDITTELLALAVMGLVLFGAAVLLFNRRSESLVR